MPTKSDLISEALLKRYPCMELPIGALTDIANEFGATRELARRVALDAGFPAMGARGNVRHPSPKRFCAKCGTELHRYSRAEMCNECKWIELPCTECGKPKRILASELARRVGGEWGKRFTERTGLAYTGRVFCNRQCFGAWVGKNKRPRKHIVRHGTRYEYNNYGCRCELCVTASKAWYEEHKDQISATKRARYQPKKALASVS